MVAEGHIGATKYKYIAPWKAASSNSCWEAPRKVEFMKQVFDVPQIIDNGQKEVLRWIEGIPTYRGQRYRNK